LIGLSANDVSSHNEWIKVRPSPISFPRTPLTSRGIVQDINEISGGELKFPIIGDKDRSISTTYDMLDYQDASNVDAKGMPFTVRTVFVSTYLSQSFNQSYST
jgi:alkyl hydroperoxide reductase subunit AhpC